MTIAQADVISWLFVVNLAVSLVTLLLLLSIKVWPPSLPRPKPPQPPKKRSDGRIPLTDPDPYQAVEKPKDNGSVILLTAERDARLLDGQEE